MRRVWINEDNAHFYCDHPAEEMTEAGCRALVDKYAAGGGVGGLLFCVNVKRALFNSRAWEPIYIDYDPEGADNQPALAWLNEKERSYKLGDRGRVWLHNLWLLNERGVDHFAVWLNQCRKQDVSGWLSFRFNDCHHTDNEDAFWHSSFWRDNPGFRRIGYRDEGWIEGAYDFNHPAVVEHHFSLIKELCERYDFDGLEIDFVRWVKHFSVGGEAAGAAVITDFLRRTRVELAKTAARTGRLVKLGVRVPSDMRASLGWGYDVITWAEEKLIDTVVLGVFLSHAQFEWDVPMWRQLFGDDVKILCQPESAVRAYPAAPQIMDYGFLFGGASAALEAGADGVYLFNECYRETPGDGINEKYGDVFKKLISVAGDSAELRDMTRRQVVSYPQISPQGEAPHASLPVTFSKPNAYDFNRFRRTITLRLSLGLKPRHSGVVLRVGADVPSDAATAAKFEVWINGRSVMCQWESATGGAVLPGNVQSVLSASVPPDVLLDGVNVVEILPPDVEGNIVWCELAVGDPKASGG